LTPHGRTGWAAEPKGRPHILASIPSAHHGEVILVRGGFHIFSEGFDVIAEKLATLGIATQMYRHFQGRSIVAHIVQSQRKYGRKPVILIGHSWGANTIIRVAKTLQQKGIKVRYMVTLAATNPQRAPTNIAKLTNYYFKTDGWGEPVYPMPGFRGQLRNVDMSTTKDIHHFNVEEYPPLQNQVIDNVLRYISTDS